MTTDEADDKQQHTLTLSHAPEGHAPIRFDRTRCYTHTPFPQADLGLHYTLTITHHTLSLTTLTIIHTLPFLHMILLST